MRHNWIKINSVQDQFSENCAIKIIKSMLMLREEN